MFFVPQVPKKCRLRPSTFFGLLLVPQVSKPVKFRPNSGFARKQDTWRGILSPLTCHVGPAVGSNRPPARRRQLTLPLSLSSVTSLPNPRLGGGGSRFGVVVGVGVGARDGSALEKSYGGADAVYLGADLRSGTDLYTPAMTRTIRTATTGRPSGMFFCVYCLGLVGRCHPLRL